MRYKLKIVLSALALFSVTESCKQKDKTNGPDQPNESRMVIDESLKPIVDEELYVFNALYNDPTGKKDVFPGIDNSVHSISGVNSNLIYTPENNAVELFLADTARIALLSRDLNAAEYKELQARNSHPLITRFAIDAIALIVNQASNDTLITVSDIKKMLNGNTKTDKNIVFDNPNSGLVRYLKTFSGNQLLKGKNIYALKSNKEVIQYVSMHPDAIGIADFSWLNDPDKDYADAVNKVKIVRVKDDINKKADPGYFFPSQNTLALKQYPLSRDLYILYSTSKLGTEFASFLQSDRGQRIILKSGLLPDDIPNRRINIIRTIKTKQ